MRTKTKNEIVNIIRKKKSIAPKELVRTLKLSPQIIHRHLKELIARGSIEKIGNSPYTKYAIAGTPDFTNALKWFRSKDQPNESNEVCETRDVFTARLAKFIPLTKQGLLEDDLSLIVAVSGEIGNNCFDHNLGQWVDIPGCWFDIKIMQKKLWVLIADRGQGIYSSLKHVAPSVENDQSAMELAFNEKISGRSPEKRGNGLKYVKDIILTERKRGLACRSGKGLITLGDWGQDCNRVIGNSMNNGFGTLTILAWDLHENRS